MGPFVFPVTGNLVSTRYRQAGGLALLEWHRPYTGRHRDVVWSILLLLSGFILIGLSLPNLVPSRYLFNLET